MTADLPVGCTPESFISQTCSEVPCTTETGACTDGSSQCCYREASSSDVTINCLSYNPLVLPQPQTCSCMPCGNIDIDVIVTVTSSTDGSPVMGAMVDYAVMGGATTSTMTDSLGMFTITAPISSVAVNFNITEANYELEEHQVQLIPPGPLRISVVLLSRSIENHAQTGDNVINVGTIATVTFDDQMSSDIMSLTTYTAAEMPLSFDADLLPPVVVNNSGVTSFYGVRIIAETRLTSDMIPLTTSAMVETRFTLENDMPNDDTLSLLTFNNSVGRWMSSSPVTITPLGSNNELSASATLSDTQLPWAIGNAIPSNMICYVQVRTFRRDNNPLAGVEVVVLQLYDQFGVRFFFRSTGTTGDGSAGTANNAACLPVICGPANEGMIRALYHVYLDASPMQPMGLDPAGQAVNISTTTSSSSGPLFPTVGECAIASDGQYARFDLPIANPPPTDIEPADNDNGFVFLRVSWYDCFDYNIASTISTDPSGTILAIYSINVTESGETIEIPDDMMTSGTIPADVCTDGSITTRSACIQVEPISNVTLQVELNPMSSLYNMNNQLCSLNETIGSFMASDASDNRLRFDLGGALGDNPEMNMMTLNNMGIYFDQNSTNIAYDQCMNSGSRSMAQLNGAIAIFDCYRS